MYKLPVLFRICLMLTFSTFIFCKKEDSGSISTPSSSGSNKLSVQTLVVNPQALSSDIEVPGTLLPNETTVIRSEISGRISNLYIRDGATVSSGALLVKLDDAELQAQMRKLDVQLKIATETEKRQAALLDIQGISEAEYSLSLLEVLSLQADIDIIKENIRKTEIRAPYSGKLGLKNISPGAFVTPADILTTISQVNTLKLQFNVPERYGAQLKPGMEVSFLVDGSDMTYTASIIASEINIEEATRSLAFRAQIRQSNPVLIPGAFAKVQIRLGQESEALMVPNSAIIPSGRVKQLYLYSGGKALMKEVTTGVRDSTNIQVLTGLQSGDTVITSAILYLRPGMEVKLAEGS